MEKELIFACISLGIYLIGVIPYWIDTYNYRTIPHFFSNIVWFILVGFNTVVLYNNGEYIPLIPSVAMTFSLLFTTFYAWKSFRKVSINWFDWSCLLFAFSAMFYWIFSRNTINTVIITIIIDFIAFLPTFKKGWVQPWTETIFTYLFASINQIFTLMAIMSPNKETTFFWLYLFFGNLIFFFFVFFRRWYIRGWKSIFE